MKIKNTVLVIASILLLSSCVVKSLNPFYTKDTISFDKKFIGEWEDSRKGTWKVLRFTNVLFNDNKTNIDTTYNKGSLNIKVKVSPVNLSKEDKLLYSKYKNSYAILRTYNDKEVVFIATPFKINDQMFLDFFPLENQEGIDNLLESHFVYTHSLVKYDVKTNGTIDIKWLDEDKIKTLFEEKKIKIKHETTGMLNEKYLLTASSKELQKFVKKYMASNDSEKWNTSTKFTLSKTDATE
ncbi:hypothetical protein [Tenacibaculum haliotis]|uniref:hypothetical protein n=1 Tax=Tenacibaculum haliotis TaxID=1888914 RepID=UPI0021B06C3C|nr:hypothetical protein [Tenacibaculum haliotis]MCT4698426.1 hypothetical protein [Tenacibaculum haliotis]